MPVIRHLFHSWERRLAAVDTNRVVRPFDWGLDWLPLMSTVSANDIEMASATHRHGPSSETTTDPRTRMLAFADHALQHSDDFYALAPRREFERQGDELRFPSAAFSGMAANDVVVARVFDGRSRDGSRPTRAVVVLPQWNSNEDGHVGLCRLFARFGLTAVRLSLPYHDARRPPELVRAEYIVSANVGQTLHANRQAVLDAKGIVDWLVSEGYERIGIIGTSLGSCLAMLAMSHDPRIRAGAFNHVSPFFADVVWSGISTRHVRAGLEGHISLEDLRRCWMPISPWPFIERVKGRNVLLVYAQYDLTFPLDLSRQFLAEFARLGIPHDTAILPCGHYSTAKAPFKYLDGYALAKFFVKRL